jgi:hypothetical protein
LHKEANKKRERRCFACFYIFGKNGAGYDIPNRAPIIMLKTIKMTHARIAMRIALSQPVWKLALKTQIQAMSAKM